MAADTSRRLFSIELDQLLHEAREAAGEREPGTRMLWPTRAEYERACTAIGVVPEDDDECDPPEFGEDDVCAAAAFELRRERGRAYAYELQERRWQLAQRYPEGIDRATYERLCAEAGIEPAAESDLDALSSEGYGYGVNVLPAMRLKLAQLRALGRLNELNPWGPAPHSQRRGDDTGPLGNVFEIISTAVVTAALVPFVQAIATKAGEDVYKAVRRLLPRLLPRREERPDVRTIEVVDPDTRTRLRLEVDLPREALEGLAELDATAAQASDRLIYWDRQRRRWTVL